MTSTATKATLWFTLDDPAHKLEKPFLHNYRVDGVQRTNLSYTSVENINIKDMRSHLVDYSQNGFTMAELDSCLKYDEFKDRGRVEGIFLREARGVMREITGTEEVFVIEYKVEIFVDDPVRFRMSMQMSWSQELFQYWAPTAVNYSGDDAVDRIRYVFGDKAESYLDRSFQLLNLWKPLKGPVRDCPLAVCDPATIDQNCDVCYVDLIDPTNVGELANIHYNAKQSWYYIRDQKATEALVFKGYDSKKPDMLGVPHCAFMKDANVSEDEVRESIEVRAVAFFP
ncbi:hypothetical protein NM208_g155 [Fusarium decemcellulare]|uniref:Uncharacterized protein n=1 Tax=Fusarium decemcellulare TaxID=57161 RepID=A0ACC1T0C9_9HYPO|nr:hypothetical protein NM208_g155 [Fusarium decemcellulare]